MPDVSLTQIYRQRYKYYHNGSPYINFFRLESLFEILANLFIRKTGQQGHVVNACLLFLESRLPVRLHFRFGRHLSRDSDVRAIQRERTKQRQFFNAHQTF